MTTAELKSPPSGGETISALPSPLYSHGGLSNPLRPMNLRDLEPLLLKEHLETLLPSSYALDMLENTLFKGALSPLNLFETLSFETLPSLLEASRFSLPATRVPLEASRLKPEMPSFNKPLVLSEIRDQNLTSLREGFPDPERTLTRTLEATLPPEVRPSSSPAPYASIPEITQPSPQPNPAPSPRFSPSPGVSPSDPPRDTSASHPRSTIHAPRVLYTPLIWDALAPRDEREDKEEEEKEERKQNSRTRRPLIHSLLLNDRSPELQGVAPQFQDILPFPETSFHVPSGEFEGALQGSTSQSALESESPSYSGRRRLTKN